jgi:hypothetical protein
MVLFAALKLSNACIPKHWRKGGFIFSPAQYGPEQHASPRDRLDASLDASLRHRDDYMSQHIP